MTGAAAGWCCLMLGTIYLIVDVCRLGFLGFFFTVAGTNSIAMYLMAQMLKPWTGQMLKKHLGSDIFSLEVGHGAEKVKLYSESYAETIGLWSPTIQAVMVGLVFWLICYYLYRQRIFIRI